MCILQTVSIIVIKELKEKWKKPIQNWKTIQPQLVELFGEEAGNEIPVLYGGSVNPENAVGLSKMEHIDGLFIGRSAWQADNFNKIIRDVLK